jgi:tetratricopeptide (TPR) repeat protein
VLFAAFTLAPPLAGATPVSARLARKPDQTSARHELDDARVWRQDQTRGRAGGQPESPGWRGRPLDELREEQARAPENSLADYNLGAALYGAGRYEEAVEFLTRAARLDAKFAAARRTLGLAYFKLARYDESVGSFKELARLQPGLAEAHNNLGVAYGKMGKHREAIASLSEAVRLEPDYAGARFNLGAALLLVSRKDAALEQHAALVPLDAALARKLFRLIYRDKILDAGGK